MEPTARLHPDLDTVDIETTLQAGKSMRGAWTKPQFAILGIDWPPIKGWKDRLVREGFRLPKELHEKFVALRKAD